MLCFQLFKVSLIKMMVRNNEIIKPYLFYQFTPAKMLIFCDVFTYNLYKKHLYEKQIVSSNIYIQSMLKKWVAYITLEYVY